MLQSDLLAALKTPHIHSKSLLASQSVESALDWLNNVAKDSRGDVLQVNFKTLLKKLALDIHGSGLYHALQYLTGLALATGSARDKCETRGQYPEAAQAVLVVLYYQLFEIDMYQEPLVELSAYYSDPNFSRAREQDRPPPTLGKICSMIVDDPLRYPTLCVSLFEAAARLKRSLDTLGNFSNLIQEGLDETTA
jgi:hypothetical protein